MWIHFPGLSAVRGETMISIENLLTIRGKRNSGSVSRIVHVCGLRVYVTDSGMPIQL
jgi:hypothetical protein